MRHYIDKPQHLPSSNYLHFENIFECSSSFSMLLFPLIQQSTQEITVSYGISMATTYDPVENVIFSCFAFLNWMCSITGDSQLFIIQWMGAWKPNTGMTTTEPMVLCCDVWRVRWSHRVRIMYWNHIDSKWNKRQFPSFLRLRTQKE